MGCGCWRTSSDVFEHVRFDFISERNEGVFCSDLFGQDASQVGGEVRGWAVDFFFRSIGRIDFLLSLKTSAFVLA